MKAFWFYSEARSLHRIPEYGAPSVNVAQKILLTDFYVVQFFFLVADLFRSGKYSSGHFFKNWSVAPLSTFEIQPKM